jgi:membrane protease YdiL (CAAX protease family)
VKGHPPPSPRGLPYHLVLLGGRPGWWRLVVGILALVLGMLVVAVNLWQVPFMVYFAASGQDVGASVDQMIDFSNPTPLGLAYLNLVLATGIPLTWLIIRVVHGLRPRWLASVLPRLRWRYLLACVGLALLALIVTIVVSALLPAQPGGDVSGELNDFTRTTRDFVLVLVLLTPLQAVGEEYAFRGYLTQAFGGIFRHPVPPVLAQAVLFALAHGLGQGIPIFFDRLAFGLVAGTLVILTGGLEAGIAMHVVNNLLAFGLALAFGDMGSSLEPTGGSWWMIPVTLTQSLVYLGLALLVARRMGLATRADPIVLAAPQGRV